MGEADEKSMSREWHYHPELPLADSSIFRWPPDPGFIAGWFVRNWLVLSERVSMVILAVVLWAVAYPSLEAAGEFAAGWVLQVWLVNLAIMLLVAGGLHGYFISLKRQGNRLKFDARDQAVGHRRFDFKNQVYDNMFWSLGSGVAQLTAFQVLTMWLMANGYAPAMSFVDNPVWFVAALVLLPIWSAFHFYWVHRLLHVPFFYKHFHALHHRNINIGPWSGIAMHPVEHFLYFSSLAIHWVVPTHPIHLVFHVVYQGPGAAMTHTGYEDLLIKDRRRLALGTFYHQLHHRYFTCNYGNQEMPWDRWFGTFHDGTEAANKRTRELAKKIYG